MAEEIDLLANCKWSDMGLNKRLNQIEYLVKLLRQSDTLTPENWEKIIAITFELNNDVDELIDYAISTHSNMIGGYSNG